MDASSHQFLAGSSLPQDEHRRIAGRYGLHLSQSAPEVWTLADDLFEVMAGADLFLQVNSFSLEPGAETDDLSAGRRVVHRNANPKCDLLQKALILGAKGILP